MQPSPRAADASFVRTRTLIAILVVALCTVAVAQAAPTAPATSSAAGMTRSMQLENDLLAQLNAVRRAHDLVPLKLSAPLSKAAAEHSREMGLVGYFQHDSAGGAAFWKRIERYYPAQGQRYWSVGENLLWSAPDVDGPGALKLWMASPEHRANILTPRWREIGVAAVAVPSAPGTYDGADVTIVTTDFGVRR
jgi:uncharacterized protein YkwD